MAITWFRGRKPTGTVIQRRSGYIYVKTEKGWVPESRLVASLKLIKRDLEEGERVFHKDGNRENNRPENLSVIKFNMTKYQLLPSARIIHLPKAQIGERELARLTSRA